MQDSNRTTLPKTPSITIGIHYFIAALSLLAALLCAAGTAGAEWFVDSALDTAYDDNLSRALDKADRKADFAFVPHVSLGQYGQLTDSLGAALTADASSGVYSRYDGLNYVDAGLGASLKYKYGVGANAPWLKGYGSVKYVASHEDMKNGVLLKEGVLACKRVHERIILQLGYEHENLGARNSLFDRKSDAVSVRADLSLAESLQLSVGYGLKRGYVAVYAPTDEDTIFAADTFHDPMEVYRIRATTRTVTIGLNKTLTNDWSAGIAADFLSVHGNGSSYPDTLLTVGIHYSY